MAGMEGQIIYIAGKITGDPDYREKFENAARGVRILGGIPLNPADLPGDMPREKYMPICLAMIDQADAVLFLDNWKNSAGAKIEEGYAKYQNKVLYYQRGER